MPFERISYGGARVSLSPGRILEHRAGAANRGLAEGSSSCIVELSPLK